MSQTQHPHRPLLAPTHEALVVGLWAPYTAINLAFPGPALTYTLGLAVAAVALGALLSAGLTPADLGLRLARPSLAGLSVLALLCTFVPLALLLGRGQPWRPLDDLAYAPASALGQELYFRAALLTALLRGPHVSPRGAVALQAALFALWHVRALRVVGVDSAAAVVVGTLVGGWAWGWQARRDRTVLYAIVQHSLFLVVQ